LLFPNQVLAATTVLEAGIFEGVEREGICLILQLRKNILKI
jgi:hypothetical protein